ncbi:MFS transporter [Streptomyces sp. NPDC102441]|uniref:MFS transporter n=1 Tax=Streptomyces sp. NPDC102441 TaxID=3366176 RepID=UPI0038287CD1
MSATASAPPCTAGVPSTRAPALWLALLAAPVAMGSNAPVLILPDVARSLGVPAGQATWLVTAFAWAMTVGTPLCAALVRHRGLRPALLTSVAAVMAGTALGRRSSIPPCSPVPSPPPTSLSSSLCPT